SVLLVLWVFHHPNVLTQLDRRCCTDICLGDSHLVVECQSVSQYLISRTMLQRQKLDKLWGSAYDNMTVVSDQMKAANVKFGILHGISSLANLGAVIALIFHGLCLEL
ncbi:hypothetical protein L210DRAFT_841324, partial [Boletus edulis BED1]